MVYEVFNVKNETYDLMRNKRNMHKKLESTKKIDHKKSSDEEEETTIDEVIQELRNIVNNAETEQYKKGDTYDGRSSRCNQTSEVNVSVKTLECKKHRDEDNEDSITSTRHSIQIMNSSNEYLDNDVEEVEETKIIPSKILPHPPRKAKSLIHLFVPPSDQGLYYKRPDFFDDNYYSSDEGSDSLLSTSRCENQVTKKDSGSSFDFQECRAMFNSLAEKDTDENRGKRSRTRSREECRKTSIKRSESFQASEKGSRQREYIDSMFFNESHTSPVESNLQRSNSKCSRVDEIVNLIESKKLTKSLDRIDEGLNSMVDIVMLAEPKKPSWPYDRRQRSCSRANSDAGKESPIVPITRSNSRLNSFTQKFDFRSSSKGKEENNKIESQKFFLPHPKLSTGSFDNHSPSYTNPTFLVKRGHSNAGFYSGTHMLRDAPASMTSLVMNGTHSHADFKRTMSPIGGSNNFGLHKVTDMPSGLY